MADRRTAEILLSMEQRLESAHEMLESAHEILVDLARRAREEKEVFPSDEISAKIQIGGLQGSISREFWEKHGDRVKWYLFALGAWTAGWLSKIIHLQLSK